MRTVVCIASGPSLTAEDCALVRASGCFAIVVNSSYRLAPWANVLYAGDRQWWNYYGDEVRPMFKDCWTASHDSAQRYDVRHFEARDFENSGYQAVELAIQHYSASQVVLLGYDMQHADGRRHWHADHPEGMENADAVHDWPDRFIELRDKFTDVRIINATRETALTCFERMALLDALGVAC